MTSNFQFAPATKKKAKLRMTINGPAGAGKTFSALKIATGIVEREGGEVAVIDTEHGSASKYADNFRFQVLELTDHSPHSYLGAIQAAAEAGFAVCIIDSLSHAWSGKNGALEQVDKMAGSGSSFNAWRSVTPKHNDLVEAILAAPVHVIATMRTKTAYVVEKNEKGKDVPRKLGMAPVQRDGIEYEFDVIGDLDQDNTLTVSKTRCPALRGGVFPLPGQEIADALVDWLWDGADDPHYRRADDLTRQSLEKAVRRIQDLDPKENGPRTTSWWERNKVAVLMSQSAAAEKLERIQRQIETLESKNAAQYTRAGLGGFGDGAS